MLNIATTGGRRAGQSLSVQPDQLTQLGWKSLRARDRDLESLLPPLLEELRAEPCAHSWREYLPPSGPMNRATATRLMEREAVARPTRTFAYVAHRLDGSEEVVAAASVSDRVRGDFPYDGFPVLARCYIRPAYRRKGLYEAILRHRFEDCLSRWGDDLKGIHLGSGDAAVWWVATRLSDFKPPFLHVGHEDLQVAGDVHDVRDLLAFAPAYVTRLLDESEAAGEGERARALLRHVEQLTSRGLPDAGVVSLRELAQAAGEECGADLLKPETALASLVALAEAIPVVR